MMTVSAVAAPMAMSSSVEESAPLLLLPMRVTMTSCASNDVAAIISVYVGFLVWAESV